MAVSWEEQKSHKRPLGLIITAILTLILIVFFILNNIDVFIPASKKDPQKPHQQLKSENDSTHKPTIDSIIHDTVTKTDASIRPAHPEKEEKKISIKPGEKTLVKKEPTEDRGNRFGVEIPGVVCKLDASERVSVQISLKLFVKEKTDQQDVLFRRDDIKMMIKRVLADKKLSDIVVDELRSDIQHQINTLLEKNSVVDIEFLDFRPIEK